MIIKRKERVIINFLIIIQEKMAEKKIRIVQFIITFGVGGAENIAKQYCELIDRNKFEVLVIAIGNQHSYHDLELKEKGIDVVYVNDIIDKKFCGILSSLRRPMHYLFRPHLLKKIINDFNPDIIHYHLPCSKLILQASPKKNVKIFLTVHSDPVYFWDKNSQWKNDYKSTMKLAQKYKFTFIALHNNMKKAIDKVWFKSVNHNTIILNNGIDLAKFENLLPRGEILYELGIPEKSFVIGHVGSLIAVKNHDFLIDVFFELKKQCPEAILLLVGDGVNRSVIEEKIKSLGLENSVKLLGIRSDIPQIMKAFDVLVFPSITEGISLTLIEAQVSGLKCILSDTIPKYNEISTNLVKFLSLNDTPQIWAKNILDAKLKNIEYSCDSSAWDIKEVVRILEKEYEKVCDL